MTGRDCHLNGLQASSSDTIIHDSAHRALAGTQLGVRAGGGAELVAARRVFPPGIEANSVDRGFYAGATIWGGYFDRTGSTVTICSPCSIAWQTRMRSKGSRWCGSSFERCATEASSIGNDSMP